MQLTEIKALLGSVNQTKTVMGFISQLEDGQYFIEDLSGALKIDLSDAMTAAGFYVGKNLPAAQQLSQRLSGTCLSCHADTLGIPGMGVLCQGR